MGCGAAVGGADGGLTLDDCTFIANVGGFGTSGGAVCLSNVELTVTNCVFIGNEAHRGGGMSLWETNGTLTNCLFSGNSEAGLGGGGLHIGPGSVGLTNCVFSGNSSGIWVKGWITGAAEATLTNCILWDNGGTTEEQQIEVDDSYPGTVRADYSCIQGWTGQWEGVGTIDDDPLFIDPDGGDDLAGTEDDDLRLSAGSPCIDAGDSLAVPVEVTTDLDGNPRFRDDPRTLDTGVGPPPVVDMGAYEYFADCNGNGVRDDYDIAAGTSWDCNENIVPDECELAASTSADLNDNGVLDECEGPKNRYLPFVPGGGTEPVAYQITLTHSGDFPGSVGQSWWADSPESPGIVRLTDGPVFRDWSGDPPLIHVGDCPVVPVATFEIRSTPDGVVFSDPVVVPTVGRPGSKQWGDVVGTLEGGSWGWPNGVVNMDDVMAAVQKFQHLPTAPPLVWVDVDGEIPNAVLNFTDIFRIVQGFKGEPYPFSDPAECP